MILKLCAAYLVYGYFHGESIPVWIVLVVAFGALFQVPTLSIVAGPVRELVNWSGKHLMPCLMPICLGVVLIVAGLLVGHFSSHTALGL